MGIRSISFAVSGEVDSEAPIKKAAAVTTNHKWAIRFLAPSSEGSLRCKRVPLSRTGMGHKRPIETPPAVAACPLCLQ
jgi:hypothetical protein